MTGLTSGAVAVIHEDHERLVLRAFPAFSLICCLAFLAVLVVIGVSEPWRMSTWKGWVLGGGALFTLAFIVAIGEWGEAVFDRAAGRFRLHRRRIFGTRVVELPIHEISGAGIQDLGRNYGEAYSLRRVVVATADSTIPLTVYFHVDRGEALETAARIRRFLAAPGAPPR